MKHRNTHRIGKAPEYENLVRLRGRISDRPYRDNEDDLAVIASIMVEMPGDLANPAGSATVRQSSWPILFHPSLEKLALDHLDEGVDVTVEGVLDVRGEGVIYVFVTAVLPHRPMAADYGEGS
jgi:hypothetical protein